MSLSARLARLRGPIGTAAALALGVGALIPLEAAAQAKKPAAPAPQAAPAQPAAPGQPGQPGQGQQGPVLVSVKPEPSQTDWTKVCGKDPNQTEICTTTRDFVSDQGQPVLAVAVYDIKNGQANQPKQMIRFLVPVGLLLQPGIRYAVDQGNATDGRYAVCVPNGCFAEAPLGNDVLGQLKKGGNLNISVQNQAGQVVTFQAPLAGFGKAFEGAAIDPKVLQEQQKKLQEEMQKRSDELRKKLEQQSNAAGGTPPKP